MIRFLLLLLCAISTSCSTVNSAVEFTVEGEPAFTPEKAEATYEKLIAVMDLAGVQRSGLQIGTSSAAISHSVTKFPRGSSSGKDWKDAISISYSGGDSLNVRLIRTSDRKEEFTVASLESFAQMIESAMSALANQGVKVRRNCKGIGFEFASGQ